MNELKISTPGRMCLFGEHQDYLHLPVIPCAISLRISIEGKRRNDQNIIINLPDIHSSESIVLGTDIKYNHDRDYFKSVINLLQRYGYTFNSGFDCNVCGNIPINSGTSSSSALVVSWVNFLTNMSDQAKQLSPEEIAQIAYEAEVLEFNEPGGMMDQYSTALGGVIFIDFHPQISITEFPDNLKTFVIGDSGEPKNTKYILATVKNQILDSIKKIQVINKNFSLYNADEETLDIYSKNISIEQCELLKGTLFNRDITQEAKIELMKVKIDDRYIGELLNKHQNILRDILKISTPKIDRMIDAALNAGAVGAKINGSGGGGCMFAYAPENPERVAEAIRKSGGVSYIVTPDCGTRIENI